MKAAASAPGKLVATGDFAVLAGAPARVIAMPQRAQVQVQPSGDHNGWLRCPPVVTDWTAFTWSDGAPAWPDDTVGERLAWVGGLLAALGQAGALPAVPLAIEIDSRAFHRADGGKLGLGASAAIVVALDHALTQATTASPATPAPDTEVELSRLIALHRAIQGGSGSGVDVAAALLGGSVSFRLVDGEPQALARPLPADVELCAVVTPDSVSTADALHRLRQWQQRAPAHWDELQGRLEGIAEQANQATAGADFCAAVSAYGEALADLETAADMTIHGDAHRAIAGIAERMGVAYKPSGAGGDCGIAAATEHDRLVAFREAVAAAGFLVLDMAPAGDGRRQETAPARPTPSA